MKKWLFLPLIATCCIQCKHKEDSSPLSDDIANYKVEALGDIEGNWTKVTTFLENSELLKVNAQAPDDEEKIEMVGNSGTFVFLGDSIDSGSQNQKVLRFLTSLKQRYPNRVILILGNRDINKLRFLWELKADALKMDDPATMYSLDRFRLTSWADDFAAYATQKDPTKPPLPLVDGVSTAYTHGQNIDSDKVLKAKFLLAKTLGCAATFKDLKTELQAATDIEVIHFLENLPQKGSLLNKYLHMAQLIYYDQNTKTLFMHGGISETNYGTIPGIQKKNIQNKEELIAWTKELNQWAQDRLADADRGDIEKSLPLVQYQEPIVQTLPNGKTSWVGPQGPNVPNPESVVQARPWVDPNNIDMIPEALQTLLMKAGVTRLVFGHSPVGDVPVFMRNGSFEMIAADTTFALQPHNATVVVTPTGSQIFATYNTYAEQKPLAAIASSTKLLYNSAEPALGKRTLVALADSPQVVDRIQWDLGVTSSKEEPKQRLHLYFKKAGLFTLPAYSLLPE